jgi:sulfatase maturation enzyme AslB (radical SAM superfamily)
MSSKQKIIIAPFNYYFGVFLNMGCSLPCEYCVQKISLPAQPVKNYPIISGSKWVEALNGITGRTKKRFLRSPKKKKIAITGGEPSLHPDFVEILNGLDNDWKVTVTSNFTSPFFDRPARALKNIRRRRTLKFNASYHFMYAPIEKFIENVQKMKRAGHVVHDLFIVAHPARIKEVEDARQKLLEVHASVKLQRFFGKHEGRLYPDERAYDIACEQEDGIRNYDAYREGFNQSAKKDIYCVMKKVLFAPNGDIYNCHYKLYTGHADKFGNIFNEDVYIVMPEGAFLCHDFGFCNPCDSEGHVFRRLDGEEVNIGEKPAEACARAA